MDPSRTPSPANFPTMTIPGYCHHSFKIIKSDTTALLWECGMCHSGPHWFIFECKDCGLKTCRPCTFNA